MMHKNGRNFIIMSLALTLDIFQHNPFCIFHHIALQLTC
jgi:hypothetical protein